MMIPSGNFQVVDSQSKIDFEDIGYVEFGQRPATKRKLLNGDIRKNFQSVI